jgi:F-type H+-transporting ATPase subunit b
MEETLKQIAVLVRNAVPTILLLLTLFAAYNLLVHRRLTELLAERHRRTQGAIERAEADVAAAETRTAEYEQRIRDAKVALYRQYEARRKQLQESRAAASAEARAAAEARARQAREQIGSEVASAKSTLQGEAEALAEQVIRAVLTPASKTPAASVPSR